MLCPEEINGSLSDSDRQVFQDQARFDLQGMGIIKCFKLSNLKHSFLCFAFTFSSSYFIWEGVQRDKSGENEPTACSLQLKFPL